MFVVVGGGIGFFVWVFFEGSMILSMNSVKVQVSLLIQGRHSGP